MLKKLIFSDDPLTKDAQNRDTKFAPVPLAQIGQHLAHSPHEDGHYYECKIVEVDKDDQEHPYEIAYCHGMEPLPGLKRGWVAPMDLNPVSVKKKTKKQICLFF